MKRHVEATVLRADLLAAGVTREVLFLKQPGVEPLRFHDLRATFVTWAKRMGKGDGWISDRTGHLSPGMIERYSRAARTAGRPQDRPLPGPGRSRAGTDRGVGVDPRGAGQADEEAAARPMVRRVPATSWAGVGQGAQA